ncbi:MAG: HEPN domain-containing protein [Elusimicrobia bacterium]|nr:HEPN domain-containing protein [Elusimicrobiota bacterium]
MKRPTDLARRFLDLADRDIKAFRKLVPDREIDDAVIGFHAQQAVEKCLKAVLARHEVTVRKVHDLHALMDLLAEHRLPVPAMRKEIVELNPFAVMLRYELAETDPLDRALATTIVDSVRRWAGDCVSK